MKHLGSSRIFASNYQLMITDSMTHGITEDINWDDEKGEAKRKFRGAKKHRMLISTKHPTK